MYILDLIMSYTGPDGNGISFIFFVITMMESVYYQLEVPIDIQVIMYFVMLIILVCLYP